MVLWQQTCARNQTPKLWQFTHCSYSAETSSASVCGMSTTVLSVSPEASIPVSVVSVSVSVWLGDCSGMVSGTAPDRSMLARGLSWSSSVLVSLSWLARGGRCLGPLTASSCSESESRDRPREPDEPREFPEGKTCPFVNIELLSSIGLTRFN